MGVGVAAAVAAMTVVIALVDLRLQSSREMAELYEGRSVTMRLTLENSAAQGGRPLGADPPRSPTPPTGAPRPPRA